MSQVSELKNQLDTKLSELFKKHNVFFAFSKSQFEEGAALNPIEEGDKYVQSGSGMIMPKSKAKQFQTEFEAIHEWYSKELNATPEIRRAYIVYELGNHESWYTYDIGPAFDMIKTTIEDVTEDEVWAIFHEEAENNEG